MTFRARFLVPLLLAGLALSGCGEASGDDYIERESPCAELDAAGQVWESAGFPPDNRCDWLDFPGFTTVLIPHDLPTVPRSIEVYLSFDPEGSISAPAAGDLARIVSVDAEAIELRNRTDQFFYAKVVLR